MSQIPGIPPTTAAADLVATINDRIRRINAALAALPAPAAAGLTRVLSPAGSVISGGGINITFRTLTIPTTLLTPPSDGSTLWVVIVQQDGTGGRGIQWAANVANASTSIDSTLGTVTGFILALTGLRWYVVPGTGDNP